MNYNEYDKYYKILEIYREMFSCQTMRELSFRVKLSGDSINRYLKSKEALNYLGEERMTKVKAHLEKMLVYSRHLAGVKTNFLYGGYQKNEGTGQRKRTLR